MGTTRTGKKLGWSAAAFAVSLIAATAGMAKDEPKDNDAADAIRTDSPIKHVIILIGENRGTDHTFGVYAPKGRHQTISNILSKGIVRKDGSPGRNFELAQQFMVEPQSSYYVGAPKRAKTAYGGRGQMPQPNTAGAPPAQSLTGAPFPPGFPEQANQIDPNADFTANTNTILTTGATNLPPNSLDTPHPRRRHAPQRAVRTAGIEYQRRRLHRRHDTPVLPGLAAVGLQHCQRHEGESDGMPQ